MGIGYAFLVAIRKGFSRSSLQEISNFRKKSTFSRKLTVLTILKKKKIFGLALSFGFSRKCCIESTEKGWNLTVFRIPGILMRIRISGSVQWITDLDPARFTSGFQETNKKLFFLKVFSVYYLL